MKIYNPSTGDYDQREFNSDNLENSMVSVFDEWEDGPDMSDDDDWDWTDSEEEFQKKLDEGTLTIRAVHPSNKGHDEVHDEVHDETREEMGERAMDITKRMLK